MTTKLRIGDWCVDPIAGQLSHGDDIVRVEARTMRLLLDLADHAGHVVSIDDLLDRVWAGVTVTPDSVYQAVAALRRLLGDDPKHPIYIATVPRLGYRLIAVVAPWSESTLAEASPAKARRAFRPLLAGGTFALFTLVCGFAVYQQVTRPPAVQPVTVGVMPFLDFSDAMDQEPLVDAVTEGIIDTLSNDPKLRTASFRSSFLLKGKHATIAQAAKALGVANLLEGTVRKSGDTVRITARLVRAETGFVVWTKRYDQPLRDIAKAEDDIAASAGKVLAPR